MAGLFCFGLGYAASAIADEWGASGHVVWGTHRVLPQQSNLAVPGFAFSENELLVDGALHALEQAQAVLVSISPDSDGCMVYRQYGALIAGLPNLRWLGYFSTTGVYGDAHCAWVDETTLPRPENDGARHRLMAEGQWLDLFRTHKTPVHIFRLSGIYGPGRSPLDRARAGAPLIGKPGHVFNRIHVADIAGAVIASLRHPTPGQVYNLSDDLPAGGDAVLGFAYNALGLPAPVAIAFNDAALSPPAREFYASCKQVRSDKIKARLGLSWRYPTYREGIMAEITQMM